MLLLPMRYMPLGWAATWAAHRVLRRFVDPPAELVREPAFGAGRAARNVTPAEASRTEAGPHDDW